ncbi:MAG TPA: hypothetical protein VF556_18935 [Pyrinomonadaceae bacterium]|jgi:hypothetical protein
MKERKGCSKEQIVVESFNSGFVKDEIRIHVSQCESCRETAKIVEFFQRNTINENSPKNLPAVGLIWWKAQIRNRRRAAERAIQPISIAQGAGVFIFLMILLWLAVRGSTGSSTLDSAFSRIFVSIDQVFVPLALGLVFFTFTAAILIYALRRFLIEK